MKNIQESLLSANQKPIRYHAEPVTHYDICPASHFPFCLRLSTISSANDISCILSILVLRVKGNSFPGFLRLVVIPAKYNGRIIKDFPHFRVRKRFPRCTIRGLGLSNGDPGQIRFIDIPHHLRCAEPHIERRDTKTSLLLMMPSLIFNHVYQTIIDGQTL